MDVSVRLPQTLDATTLAEVADALGRAEGVLQLRGAGAEVFCRGLDVEAVDSSELADAVRTFAGLLAQLARGGVPSLALVDGVAQGGGVGIAAACDVVLATQNARFCLPEMLFGLVPGAIWPVLRRRVSEAALVRWVKTAHTFDVAEALRLGLVDEVVASGEAERRVKHYRRLLGRPSARAHQRLEALLGEMERSDLTRSSREAAAQTADALVAPDVVNARRRFAEGGVPWEA